MSKMKLCLGSLGILGGLGLLTAIGCAADERAAGSAATLCEGLQGYVSACGSLSPCENALVRDCGALEGALSDNFAVAATDCLNNLGTPMSCMLDAVGQTPSSAKLQEFATTVCLCSSGSGDGCEEEFLTGDNSDVGRAGRLARMVNDQVLAEVETECTGGEACTDNFEDCFIDVLGRSVPSETSSCVADAVLGRAADDCEAADTEGPADTGVDTEGGSGDTDSGDDSDTSNSSDSGGDTDGVCDSEGCDCMFNEECAGDLECIDDVCTSTAECGDDPNEPNNGEIQATFLPPIGDDDGEQTTVDGELSSANDIDWFRYEGADNFGSVINPYAQLNIVALELCAYAECVEGLEATNLSCPEGTTQQPSPSGRPGCCAANSMGFELDLSCGGFNPVGDDSAIIYMSVTGSEPGVCQEYTLTYHF